MSDMGVSGTIMRTTQNEALEALTWDCGLHSLVADKLHGLKSQQVIMRRRAAFKLRRSIVCCTGLCAIILVARTGMSRVDIEIVVSKESV